MNRERERERTWGTLRGLWLVLPKDHWSARGRQREKGLLERENSNKYSIKCNWKILVSLWQVLLSSLFLLDYLQIETKGSYSRPCHDCACFSVCCFPSSETDLLFIFYCLFFFWIKYNFSPSTTIRFTIYTINYTLHPLNIKFTYFTHSIKYLNTFTHSNY